MAGSADPSPRLLSWPATVTNTWHPDPTFYYKAGGGPMLDMGPYYITALIHLLGPVTRVTGSSKITFAQRVITSKPKYGEVIDVDVTTHLASALDFANGVVDHSRDEL